ncbi:MAG: PKD domain-containing protein [Bacteroidetes bacterium]|nr:PKD domain-containing protein [Bacteroidota bacterium]
MNQPVATFAARTGCVNSQINFTNTTAGIISVYDWRFGDGGTSNVPNPAHVYTAAGTYVAWMVITNVDGCKDSVQHNVVVNPLPAANAGNDVIICSGASATLTASGGASYLWNPGPSAGPSYTVS